MLDIDGILTEDGELVEGCWVEYDNNKATALFELKSAPGAKIDQSSSQMAVLRDLGSGATKPVYGVEYYFDEENSVYCYYIEAANEIAREQMTSLCGRTSGGFSEISYVRFLYRIRGRVAPQLVLNKLCTIDATPEMFGRSRQPKPKSL